jgi:hypothetical protein
MRFYSHGEKPQPGQNEQPDEGVSGRAQSGQIHERMPEGSSGRGARVAEAIPFLIARLAFFGCFRDC